MVQMSPLDVRRVPLFRESNFLIVGLVRNCERHLARDVQHLASVFRHARSVEWLLIESDSSDRTVDILKELEGLVDEFAFESLGMLRDKYPVRTERLSFCRNRYVEKLKSGQEYRSVDYVAVADFDGVNVRLTLDGLMSCWDRDDWDMCAANQAGPYYDVWALRHEHWSPNDCWQQYHFMKKYCATPKRCADVSVYSRMITIPEGSEWIEVESAFGGLAIYRRDVLLSGVYSGVSEMGESVCEHVSLHRGLRRLGHRIFINPRMINAGYTEHSEPLKRSFRLRQQLKRSLSIVTKLVVGERGVRMAKRAFRIGS